MLEWRAGGVIGCDGPLVVATVASQVAASAFDVDVSLAYGTASRTGPSYSATGHSGAGSWVESE